MKKYLFSVLIFMGTSTMLSVPVVERGQTRGMRQDQSGEGQGFGFDDNFYRKQLADLQDMEQQLSDFSRIPGADLTGQQLDRALADINAQNTVMRNFVARMQSFTDSIHDLIEQAQNALSGQAPTIRFRSSMRPGASYSKTYAAATSLRKSPTTSSVRASNSVARSRS